jgi:phosphate starvation-inducible PhoH-like protein
MKHKRKDTSPVVSQRQKIDFVLSVKDFPWSEKQKKLIELIQDSKTKIVFIHGPAGSAKTLIAAYTALVALAEKKISDLVYVRQPVESSKYNIGYLKGDINEKLTPYLQPLEDKLLELLSKGEVNKLKEDERLICAPIGHLRGRTFNAQYVILDEAQNLGTQDFLLAMTRLGKFSKMLIIGDSMQPDIKDGAFDKVSTLFDNPIAKENGIHVFRFDKSDIFRSEILGFIIEQFEVLQRGGVK